MTTAADPPVTRAAVVIGVDRTGGLTPLRAAASGAVRVAEWLDREGYHVTLLTDRAGATITLAKIAEAVRGYVDADTVQKLVVYFAGHGYLNGTSEIWLLSGAPANANEAIDMTESAEYARSCSIQSIIFISDACRSTPQTLGAGRVRGGTIFPNRAGGSVDPEIDRFFATRPGDAAVELPLKESEKRYVGLFTEVLQRAHLNPPPSLVRRVRVDGADRMVIPNRKLKETLPHLFLSEVDSRELDIAQVPQLRLECGEDGHLAQAFYRRMRDEALTSRPTGGTPPMQATSLVSLVTAGRGFPGEPNLIDLALASTAPVMGRIGREARDQSEMDRTAGGRFETQTGFFVSGTRIAAARGIDVAARVLGHGARVRISDPSAPNSPPPRPGSVFLEFEEGTGAIVAALPGYIGAITVHKGDVVNISYEPSEGSARWHAYAVNHREVEQLRALVATSVRHGLFVVDRNEAAKFATKLRRLKAFDPTLGLYSAMAFAEVGQRAQARSVLKFMRRDLKCDLFDVWLAAGAGPSRLPRVPLCPALTQSWSFLGARGVELPPVLEQAERRQALWTTFAPVALASLYSAVDEGKIG